MNKIISGIALSIGCSLFAGCSADVGDDANLASNTEELGEAACGTVSGYPFAGSSTNGRTQLMGPNPYCSYGDTVATSPNASYSNTGCTNQFVSEVRATTGRALQASASWAGPALTTQANCQVSVMGVAMYGRTLFGTWSRIGQTHLVGKWIPASTGGFNIPAHCEFQRASGEPALPALSNGHGYNAVRTVGYGIMLFVPQRVRLGVHFGSGPC